MNQNNVADSRAEEPTRSSADGSRKPFCDVVMKGGITSGVVYPMAVCVLSQKYTFKNVGGASAGAIAAAATAAAQYGESRRGTTSCALQNEDFAFEGLAGISHWLGQGTHLRDLFRADPDTKPIYNVCLAVLSGNLDSPPSSAETMAPTPARERESAGSPPAGAASPPPEAQASAPAPVPPSPGWLRRSAAGVLAMAREPELLGFGLLLSSPILLLDVWMLTEFPDNKSSFAFAFVVLVVLGLALLLLGMLAAFIHRVWSSLPENGYGLCSGLGDDETLTVWIHRALNKLAGRAPDGDPLTFGHLWGASDDSEGREFHEDPSRRDINLEMITTNLTHGRPYRLPFDEGFYFSSSEMKKLFPEVVVKWMQGHPRVTQEDSKLHHTKNDLCPMPDPWNLPVVVATRMSLSFPILLSTVRLYAHRSNKSRTKDNGQMELTSCVFSDGGLTSNFPIHLFDHLLPRWPTFGINLREATVEAPLPEQNFVQLAQDNQQGSGELWNLFEGPDASKKSLLGFALALIETMQNWSDNALTRLPGFRDRIVHVAMLPGEGGLNLTMPPEQIQKLVSRGQKAGEELIKKFHSASGQKAANGWTRHRWVRLRSSLSALVLLMTRFRKSQDQDYADSYEDLIHRSTEKDWAMGYKPSSDEQAALHEVNASVTRLVQAWEQSPHVLLVNDNAPRPPVELRVTPRIRG